MAGLEGPARDPCLALLYYGRLLFILPVAGEVWSSYAMNGSGGNSVQVFPEQRAIVVITTTNYDVQQPHRITAKLLIEKILPGL